MTGPLKTYLAAMLEARRTGAATDETSYYPALHGLLAELGRGLSPRVSCLLNPRHGDSGQPDFMLFAAGQLGKGKLKDEFPVLPPERGVVEAKGTAADVAAVVAFLAGPGAEYITGQEIVVDGGLTM